MIRSLETLTEKLFGLCAGLCALITLLIFGFMLILGLPLLREGQIFQLLTAPWDPYRNAYGIFPMIVGTLAISLLGLVFSFPLSLGCAALISVLDTGIFSKFLRKVVELMTGIPTVIYGFVGIFILVPFIRESFAAGSGMCVLSAALMLALLVSPTMILFFSDSFNQVPRSYLMVVDSLGGSKVQKLTYVILPCAWKGVLTGLIVGLGRAFGDTMIALMLAGNAVQLPGSVLDSARTLTAHIALVIAADYESLEFKSIFACGMVLYLFTTIIILLVRLCASFSRRENR